MYAGLHGSGFEVPGAYLWPDGQHALGGVFWCCALLQKHICTSNNFDVGELRHVLKDDAAMGFYGVYTHRGGNTDSCSDIPMPTQTGSTLISLPDLEMFGKARMSSQSSLLRRAARLSTAGM